MIIPRKWEQCEWKNRNLSVAAPELYFLKKGSLLIIFQQMIIFFLVAHWTPSTFCVAVWIGWLYPTVRKLIWNLQNRYGFPLRIFITRFLSILLSVGWQMGHWMKKPSDFNWSRTPSISRNMREDFYASGGQGAARSRAYNDPNIWFSGCPASGPWR